MNRVLILTLAACGLSAAAAAAPPATMRGRIRPGVQNGALTRGETAATACQQARLRRPVARRRATGAGVNPQERACIAANARQNSRMVCGWKHHGRTR